MKHRDREYKFTSKAWIYPGQAAWHFVSVPRKLSAQLRSEYREYIRGWNSLPIEVQVGETTWQTSIFWDSRSEAYLLPIKVKVRQKEKIAAGDTITIQLQIRQGVE